MLPDNPLILCIDTSLETANLSLNRGYEVLERRVGMEQKQQVSFLHPAIKLMLETVGVSINKVDCIAVIYGPGSYTGLRVGLSTAKGLCLALGIPLVVINTLELLSLTAINTLGKVFELYCPMIDARRMEVFTALYDKHLLSVMPTRAIILGQGEFKDELEKGEIVFFGNGSIKYKDIQQHKNAHFEIIPYSAECMAKIACDKYRSGQVADLSYVQPLYVKEFYSNIEAIK